MKRSRRSPLVLSIQAAAILLVAGCGGGGGGGSSGSGGLPVFTSGAVTAIGSVTVNGIKFEDTAADITGDDTGKVLADVRRLGAVLRIVGRLNADGVSGTADRIEIENELRGPIEAITLPDTFTALGQTVRVDGGTVFEDTTGLAGADPLAVDDIVEVHGARNAAGQILATRVERMGAAGIDELKGIITSRTGIGSGTLTIGGTAFTYDGGTIIVPAGASFGVGSLVEVHLVGNHVGRLEVEDLDEPEFEPREGMGAEVEGYVTGFANLAGTFLVGNQEVDASGAGFEGGLPSDLANDVKIEAEGKMVGGVLVAHRIEFKDSLLIQSTVVLGSVPAGGAGSFVLLDRTIFVTGTTLNNHGAIAPGDNVEIRGRVNIDGASITATRIDSVGPIDADRHVIQGPVSARDAAAMHLTILGFDVNASGSNGVGAGVEFQDRNEVPISPAAFFDAVIAGRTVVKARGTPGAGTLVANELEIE